MKQTWRRNNYTSFHCVALFILSHFLIWILWLFLVFVCLCDLIMMSAASSSCSQTHRLKTETQSELLNFIRSRTGTKLTASRWRQIDQSRNTSQKNTQIHFQIVIKENWQKIFNIFDSRYFTVQSRLYDDTMKQLCASTMLYVVSRCAGRFLREPVKDKRVYGSLWRTNASTGARLGWWRWCWRPELWWTPLAPRSSAAGTGSAWLSLNGRETTPSVCVWTKQILILTHHMTDRTLFWNEPVFRCVWTHLDGGQRRGRLKTQRNSRQRLTTNRQTTMKITEYLRLSVWSDQSVCGDYDVKYWWNIDSYQSVISNESHPQTRTCDWMFLHHFKCFTGERFK